MSTPYAAPEVVEAARAVLLRYCRAVDRCDWGLLRTVYHPDATIDHGAFQGDVSGFVAFVQSRRVGIVHSAHFLSNVLVEPVDESRVVVESYGWAVQTFAVPSPLVRPGFAGVRQRSTYRYVDLLERRDGVWAIAEGHLVLGDLEVEDLTEPPRPRDGLSQRPDVDDPLYRLTERWSPSR